MATTCNNGTEAIDLYQGALDAGSPFLAVIMDLEIPEGMGGKEAAKRILAMDPAARLIVSSGNRNDPVVTSFRNFGFCYSLPKPYSVTELTSMLSDLGFSP